MESFLFIGHPTFRFLNYSVDEFFVGLIDIFKAVLAMRTVVYRLMTSQPLTIRAGNFFRSLGLIEYIGILERFRRTFSSDRSMQAFYDGSSRAIPAYYVGQLEQRLGRYAPLLDAQDRMALSDD